MTLERKTPMKRTEMKRGTKPLPAKSAKRVKEDRVRAKVVAGIRAKIGNVCQLRPIIGTPCHGGPEDIHGHEVLKTSRGGSRVDATNILLACNYHNGWVEDYPDDAEALGISLPSKS